MVAAAASCGTNQASPDASVTPDGSTPDTGSPLDAKVEETGMPDSATGDAGLPVLAHCRALHSARPNLPTCTYTIDPDGVGPLVPFLAYCDMDFDGGGWTMVESRATNQPNITGLDAGGGAMAGSVGPGKVGYLSRPIVAALAADSTRIHIRTSFTADGGAPEDAGQWTTTREVDGGGDVPRPLGNLRQLKSLNAGHDAGIVADFGGPRGNAQYLSFQITGVCTGFDTAEYPFIYWACNNLNGLHFSLANAKWDYGSATTDPLELYLR